MTSTKNTSLTEEETFVALLENSRAAIYRICRIYAISPVSPEDLFQEVVFQAWKSIHSFSGRSLPTTWLYRVALNVCISAQLKLKRNHDPGVHLEAVRFMTPTPISPVEEERYEALRACIVSLSESDRSVIVLYLEDLPYREIAAILGLTDNHVAVKMKRIRAKLLACMTQKLER